MVAVTNVLAVLEVQGTFYISQFRDYFLAPRGMGFHYFIFFRVKPSRFKEYAIRNGNLADIVQRH